MSSSRGRPTTRRTFLIGASSGLALNQLTACSRTKHAEQATSDTPENGVRGSTRLLTWQFSNDAGGIIEHATIIVPTWDPKARYPLLIALHGQGEALKLPAVGAMGWPRDYALTRAISRLCAPPLTSRDFEGFVENKRLAQLNQSLSKIPFRGLIVACPYMPNINPRNASDVQTYARFLLDVLIPRVYRETPAIQRTEATGIDGVSLGGAVALRIGLGNPDKFGSVGSLQAALREEDVLELKNLANDAIARRSNLKIHLLTSTGDPFRQTIRRVSHAWRGEAIAHEFHEVVGPHDYAFNRGPGSLEMLLWHDRTMSVP